jgi:hypothetical protein
LFNLINGLEPPDVTDYVQTVNGPLVLGEKVSHEEAFSAQLTLKPFPCVPPHMRFQIVPLGEGSITIRTPVRFFPRVSPHMHRQIVRPSETSAAYRTQMRLLTGMVALVHCQIGGTGESLAAVFTLERFLAAMPPHVDHQVVVPDESLAALRTQELLRMFVVELHVFGQVGLRQETLVAGLALEAFLAHVALDVHVSVFLGREGLQADVALVLFLAQRLKKGSMNREFPNSSEQKIRFGGSFSWVKSTCKYILPTGYYNCLLHYNI